VEIVPVDKIPSKEEVEERFPLKFNPEEKTIALGNPREVEVWAPYTALYKDFLDMEQFCKKNDGVGLSAVQVGSRLPIFVTFLDGKWRHFLNCKYKGMSSKKKSMEGCLSLPERRFILERYSKIKVWGNELAIDQEEGLTIIEVSQVFKGMNAVIMQHEIDHQNGILISDIGKEYSF